MTSNFGIPVLIALMRDFSPYAAPIVETDLLNSTEISSPSV